MVSDDSDDEPLSTLATAKRLNPEKFNAPTSPQCEKIIYEPRRRKRRSKKAQEVKKLPLTFKISRKVKSPIVIERPKDVWLYLKDFNQTGPYSCLLCSEWFINRAKIVIHYVLNHRKDFCGICRYFVPDRAAWFAHLEFHTPWLCSQCTEKFPTEALLRLHLSSAHNLVHCRLCHFRLPDDDQYNTHLFQKHNVTNVSSKDEEYLWELEYEGSPKFLCLLCAKSNNFSTVFFNHFMGFHHFTLKCFTTVLSGKDPPFSVCGADVSSEFIETLKDQGKCGYVDLDKKQNETKQESGELNDSNEIMTELMPEVKEEVISDLEDKSEHESDTENKGVSDPQLEIVKSYKGDEDFDVTLMELIVLQKCYFDYITQTMNDINSNLVPEISDIDYEKAKSDIINDIECSLCNSKYDTVQTFIIHMNRMHSVKSVPLFSCRVCATTFDTQNELDSHTAEELGDFEDLWLCQFCDKEFDNREATRHHLTEHWEIIEYDNCFSPHLGFKCKFCPTLFWNETDRETHQVRVHFSKYRDQYYKCQHCLEVFSDKIWFIHHFLEKHEAEENKTYLLKCCICCLVLPNVDKMRSHFKENHPEAKKLFCSLDGCQYKPLSHKKSFQLHLRSQHGNSKMRKDRATSCSVCGREFPNSRACATHMTQVHGPGKFKCKMCKEQLHSMDERKLHYLIRHPGHHPFACTECGKSFQYKSSLYMHRQEHSPHKQNFTCNFCQKVFVKKDSFREHLQIHEGPRHACSYCPMRFVQRSNMLRHERRHTGERPYTCPHCPRTFADKGACTSHVRTHSRDTSFACIYCGQTFVQKSKLTYHIRKHTGENLESCPICSKLFTSACSLREHMKTHEAKKQKKPQLRVKCPLCDKEYQDEKYMLRHLRGTHADGKCPCPLCPKRFPNMGHLRSHVMSHSPINVFRCKKCPKSYAIKRTMIKHVRKRHGVRAIEDTKDFYHKLDPKDCQLGLDDEVLFKIFGPAKNYVSEMFIGDFVNFSKALKFADGIKIINNKPKKDAEDNNDDNDDDENDKSDAESEQSGKIKIKTEIQDDQCGGEELLEPTDFVSVKIEPMDEDEMGDV